MASKAEENSYRQAEGTSACFFCTNKQAVPYNWCPVIGQQIRHDMTCNSIKEVRAYV